MTIKARKSEEKRTIKDADLPKVHETLRILYKNLEYTDYPEELAEFEEFKKSNICVVDTTYTIGYFRKFNALHNYLVDNCEHPEGQDNCVDMLITKETINDLIVRLTKILVSKDDKVAQELLPTLEGFFFGSQDYDEYYYDDCKDALELFVKMSKLTDEYDFYYHAWY